MIKSNSPRKIRPRPVKVSMSCVRICLWRSGSAVWSVERGRVPWYTNRIKPRSNEKAPQASCVVRFVK